MFKNLKYTIDGKEASEIVDDFNEIIFFKTNKEVKNNKPLVVIFEDYIIKPFPGFDFHEKFNKGKKPPFKQMTGFIVKETERMYYLHLKHNDITWEGWCPKKSCKLI